MDTLVAILRVARARIRANKSEYSYVTQRECYVRTHRIAGTRERTQYEKFAILHAAASLFLSLSLSSCVSSIRMCVHTCANTRLYARDRYAIAREPTESMKIKRDYSSPSEVKDALECCDATQCNDAPFVT